MKGDGCLATVKGLQLLFIDPGLGSSHWSKYILEYDVDWKKDLKEGQDSESPECSMDHLRT